MQFYLRKWASQITCNPLNRGLLPPPLKLAYLRLQPIRNKFSHMTFDWNRSTEFENGYHRSNVILLIVFFFLMFMDTISWKAQPIRTKFSHMTFDWNSSDRFENGHRRSHVIPPNRWFLRPLKIQIPLILLKGLTNPNRIYTHDFWLA